MPCASGAAWFSPVRRDLSLQDRPERSLTTNLPSLLPETVSRADARSDVLGLRPSSIPAMCWEARSEMLVLSKTSQTTLLPGILPLAYDLTGSACTSAGYWRSSALTAPLRQLSARDSDMGSGKMSSSPFSTPSKIARATDSGEAFGTLRSTGHIRVHGTSQDGMYPHAPSGQKSAQRL